MSKISQELKALLYLNQRYARSSFISISEIADYLEVSDRQARRYMEDLSNILEVSIRTKHGRDGGYRLAKPLDKGLSLPENLVLALSIAMKRNERIEAILASLPNYVVTEFVEGDNFIDNDTLDHLEALIRAIGEVRSVSFHYRDDEEYLYFVDPYKIYYTNKTYYLLAAHKDKLRRYDCSLMKDIKILGGYKPSKDIESQIDKTLGKYGVRSGEGVMLRVRCVDADALRLFEKYFEGKGAANYDELTYEVEGSDEHELYYPLFRISTKKYVFLDEVFKDNYLTYLRKQIRSIENVRKD